MKVISKQHYSEERPLFREKGLRLEGCTFDQGESPLKEACSITMEGGAFQWKYPLWYAKNIQVKGTYFAENARAGIWYTDQIELSDLIIDAPKTFRRCNGIRLNNIKMPNAAETLWYNRDVELENVEATGDYFAMGTENIRVKNLLLNGNYSFDGCKNVEITDSKLLSKDCVWNCENVLIKNSYIEGEYLGWNSKNVTLQDCTIKSLQGMCYVENLKVINCRLEGTSLAFEFATVQAQITDSVDSVMNPIAGTITAPLIKKLIMDPAQVDPAKTTINAEVAERLDRFDGIIPD
ncbi:MAG: DUF3737 family protein [Lachnospiraceae bacterium]|nr:DUF3737 family protein [Lachnospiraceae bacterium]